MTKKSKNHVTVYVPKDLMADMKRLDFESNKSVNWSKIAQEKFKEVVDRFSPKPETSE